uniref:Tripartite motif-containing protein 16-like n=1 Tax=Acanthochromis polyacanthus TaxID=80966 RepID=A0A3Q1EA49_9TELE
MAAKTHETEKLRCWICVDLLKDPVTIPCGHNYCKKCLRSHWGRQYLGKTYSCPQCRQTFRRKLQAAAEDLCYAGPGDVSCDFCTGRKLKMFCHTDQQCICRFCSLDEHKDTVSAAAERNDKQRLVLNQEKIQQRIQDREKDVRMEDNIQSADEAVTNSEETSKDLIRLIEKRNTDVKQQIRSKQTDEVRSRSCELEQLSQSDHIQFLHSSPLMSDLSESTNPASITSVHRLQFFCDITVVVSKIKDKLHDSRKEKGTKTSPRLEDVSGLKTLSPAEPKTRAEFLQYSRRLTLDPNTAHRKILLSEGNRTATFSCRRNRSSVDHPDRFMGWLQVLSRESLTGRCYWEVEQKLASVAVTYKDISRTGPGSEFGTNDRSWALEDSFYFIHDSIAAPISGSWFSRIGIYLDHSAGILSFYRVSKTMTLIHRVQTTFTQPLYAGFRVYGFYCYSPHIQVQVSAL